MIRIFFGLLAGLLFAFYGRPYAIAAIVIVAFILVVFVLERYSVVWIEPQSSKTLPKTARKAK